MGNKMKEKFTISVSENCVKIDCPGRDPICFTASEALMLLDILQNEEENLRKMADNVSPIPIRINKKG